MIGRVRPARHAPAAAAAIVVAVALAGCSSTPRVDLPDLSGMGLAPAACDDTVQLAGIPTDQPGAELQCWTGSPGDGFIATADAIRDVLVEDTAGEDVSGALCWSDTLTDTEGSACRAVLVGGVDDGVVVSAVVALRDPAEVTAGLPDDPSEEQVTTAIAGADVEVLVFSEPASAEARQ